MIAASHLARLRRSTLTRNTLWMLVGQAARTVIQAIYFVLVAHALHPAGYGAFVAAMALVMIAAPFASLGAGIVMVKNVARDPTMLSVYWGNALAIVAASGAALLLVILGAAHAVLPATIPLALVLALGVAELVFARTVEICAQVFQAFQLLAWTSAIQLMLAGLRLASIAALYAALRSPTPLQWSLGYLAATVAAAAIAVALVHVRCGRPRPVIDRARMELREGAYFSIGLSAQSIYNDIDKTMLSRLSTLAASGVYGAAYRIIDVSFAPISALLWASYARFFQHGTQGLQGTLRLARKLLPLAAAYGAAAGLALAALAPLAPRVLGERYALIAPMILWLAPLPLLRACHYFLADALTGAGHQRARSAVQIAVAVVNVLFNLWIIPIYSWKGAAWTSLGCDGLLALGLLWVVVRIGRS
ncbi:MAG: polysaccharide biosynthesis protein [Deltaproteobacteria bacterium]|nr:MAG: polysaccharide biosynthesis protein [Deltaproteobacteria bacterium]